MENPPDPRPVFEADQVITFIDLYGIRNGYIYRHQTTPKYRFYKRFMYRVGVGVCNELLHWLSHGKPPQGVNCQGGHDGV